MAAPNLRKSMIAAVAGASALAMAVTPLAPANAQDAQLQPAAATTTTATSNKGAASRDGVRQVDLSEVTNSYVRGHAMAVRASGDYAIVKVHSRDPAVIGNVDRALRGMMEEGYLRVGIVIAEGKNGFDNSAELYLMSTDGKPDMTYNNIEINTDYRLNGSIKDIYPYIWITRN